MQIFKKCVQKYVTVYVPFISLHTFEPLNKWFQNQTDFCGTPHSNGSSEKILTIETGTFRFLSVFFGHNNFGSWAPALESFLGSVVHSKILEARESSGCLCPPTWPRPPALCWKNSWFPSNNCSAHIPYALAEYFKADFVVGAYLFLWLFFSSCFAKLWAISHCLFELSKSLA